MTKQRDGKDRFFLCLVVLRYIRPAILFLWNERKKEGNYCFYSLPTFPHATRMKNISSLSQSWIFFSKQSTLFYLKTAYYTNSSTGLY